MRKVLSVEVQRRSGANHPYAYDVRVDFEALTHGLDDLLTTALPKVSAVLDRIMPGWEKKVGR